MEKTKSAESYIPLSETTFLVMVCLVEPLHGYAVMQKAEQISNGAVRIGAGTLYTIFANLEAENIITLVSETDRRKTYSLSAKGKEVLRLQIARALLLAKIAKNANEQLG